MAMSHAEIGKDADTSCVHESACILFDFHRANARDRRDA